MPQNTETDKSLTSDISLTEEWSLGPQQTLDLLT